MYHHLSESSKRQGFARNINTRVADDVSKILSSFSREVTASDGYFIKQEHGQFYLIYEKKLLLQKKYLALVGAYLQANNKQITCEAKRVFESENEQSIEVFVKKVIDSKNHKIARNTGKSKNSSRPVNIRILGH